jgi:hypothetical protein
VQAVLCCAGTLKGGALNILSRLSVLTAIVSGYLAHTQTGYIRVRAVHVQGEDGVEILVTDTGIGVAQVCA